MARNSRRTSSFLILLLLHKLFVSANESGFPPVTLFLIGSQILLFLRFIQVPWGDDTSEICMSVNSIYYGQDYRRFLFAAFEHADDYHLYYNMISFMVKGKTLEKIYGSGYFAFICLVFTFLTNLVYLFLNYALSIFLMDRTFMFSCAVGFSGTIFALKVLSTSLWDTQTQFMFGGPISGKYAVWVELIFISLVTPNASFVGHLAGILVGTAYTQGPLKAIMQSIWSYVITIWNAVEAINNPNRPRNSNQSAYLDDDEAMRRAREQSYRDFVRNQQANYYGPRFRPGFSPMF